MNIKMLCDQSVSNSKMLADIFIIFERQLSHWELQMSEELKRKICIFKWYVCADLIKFRLELYWKCVHTHKWNFGGAFLSHITNVKSGISDKWSIFYVIIVRRQTLRQIPSSRLSALHIRHFFRAFPTRIRSAPPWITSVNTKFDLIHYKMSAPTPSLRLYCSIE